jgi:hypothetical protein
MSIDTLLVILLVWTVAGLLAAIAFGKMARGTSQEEEESLATSAGTVKYLRKAKDTSRDASVQAPVSRHGTTKHASG